MMAEPPDFDGLMERGKGAILNTGMPPEVKRRSAQKGFRREENVYEK